MTWFLVLLILLTAAAGAYAAKAAARAAFARGRREAELEAAARAAPLVSEAARLPALQEEVRTLRERLERSAEELLGISRQNAGLQTQIAEWREREPQMREALQRELSQLAGKFLDEKGKAYAEQNLVTLDGILAPLRERIKDFEKKVDDSHKEGRDQHTQLRTQIEMLYKMNDSLGQEARNLTVALKGENKKGGNWGEVVLERVLESSGLEKGREYRVQPSYNDGTGAQQPDVVIDLPDNRHLVIDSKVSLLAYERYCSAETPDLAEAEMKAHLQSVKAHIDGLSGKRYHEIHALNSVDFVFLFMPVEPAFIEASKRDPALFQSAFAKNIILVSPSTLLATLRTVASIWKQEHQNRNVRDIARQAGALYDKFVGFLADLDKIGRSLAATQESFNEARSKLSGGKGNLVSRVQNLHKLGVKSSKEIPMAWRGDEEEAPEMPEHTSETLPPA